MIQVVEQRGKITGVAVSRISPRISHLLFLDDSIIFGHAQDEELVAIQRILQTYGAASRQDINLEKSSMVVSGNVLVHQQCRSVNILGLQVVQKHDKYLGLPAVTVRSRGELLQDVKDQVWSHVQGWNSKLLSQAGKGVLIKYVIQAIYMYVMSCFKMLDYIVRELEAMTADF
ncbi:UNVERIFIED_CONTAM: hypothetical protein Sangu_2565700 [Sesamum angustifolium]|uniref:Reverse transcriptase n=1 Tax=Sesamum angustifolium TaxID=2727405 RepID=A0AAW2J9H3_9LAMI